jgi:Pyridoxamine 5'-phosphate oxidase
VTAADGERPGILPAFPDDLVGILATIDAAGPAAIPVSALYRAADDRILLALAPRRRSLARLRAHPAVALALLGPGFSVTAYGAARVVAEPLAGADFVVGVELEVDEVTDTLGGRTLVYGGVWWGWRDDGSAARHAEVRAALASWANAPSGNSTS